MLSAPPWLPRWSVVVGSLHLPTEVCSYLRHDLLSMIGCYLKQQSLELGYDASSAPPRYLDYDTDCVVSPPAAEIPRFLTKHQPTNYIHNDRIPLARTSTWLWILCTLRWYLVLLVNSSSSRLAIIFFSILTSFLCAASLGACSSSCRSSAKQINNGHYYKMTFSGS